MQYMSELGQLKQRCDRLEKLLKSNPINHKIHDMELREYIAMVCKALSWTNKSHIIPDGMTLRDTWSMEFHFSKLGQDLDNELFQYRKKYESVRHLFE